MGKETLGWGVEGFKTWLPGHRAWVTDAHVTVAAGETLVHLSGDIVDKCPENTPSEAETGHYPILRV